jgi:predicted transcriptional regulator
MPADEGGQGERGLENRRSLLAFRVIGAMITSDYKGTHAMSQAPISAPITIRTSKVAEIDALANAMDRSRNYIVNAAIEQYLASNAWQMQRIADGLSAVETGHVEPAETVFENIAAKHGWAR